MVPLAVNYAMYSTGEEQREEEEEEEEIEEKAMQNKFSKPQPISIQSTQG